MAGSVAYRIKVKNLSCVNVELYTGVNEKLEVPVMLPPVLDKLNLENMKVLICDDVVDSGQTLQMVDEFCEGVVAESRTAALYQKPAATVECDYFWKKTDQWIDFPWSTVGQ